MVLGVDIGNVIINNRSVSGVWKNVTEEEYLAFPPTEGVFDALKKLNEHFDGNVYLISKCSEWAEDKIIKWLTNHDFYMKTEIDPSHIRFVRERHEKDAVCRVLGVTHFIDDRLEVLSHMVSSTPQLFLFQPNTEEVKLFESFLPSVVVVENWEQLIKEIGV